MSFPTTSHRTVIIPDTRNTSDEVDLIQKMNIPMDVTSNSPTDLRFPHHPNNNNIVDVNLLHRLLKRVVRRRHLYRQKRLLRAGEEGEEEVEIRAMTWHQVIDRIIIEGTRTGEVEKTKVAKEEEEMAVEEAEKETEERGRMTAPLLLPPPLWRKRRPIWDCRANWPKTRTLSEES